MRGTPTSVTVTLAFPSDSLNSTITVISSGHCPGTDTCEPGIVFPFSLEKDIVDTIFLFDDFLVGSGVPKHPSLRRFHRPKIAATLSHVVPDDECGVALGPPPLLNRVRIVPNPPYIRYRGVEGTFRADGRVDAPCSEDQQDQHQYDTARYFVNH